MIPVCGIFGYTHEEAAELYGQAATHFKIDKERGRAGAVYTKLANCHLKSKNKDEAASAYVDAARCYKKSLVQDAAQCFDKAVALFLEIGDINSAAQHDMELGELYEEEENFVKAMDYFEKAANHFEAAEEADTSEYKCNQKVAQFAAQLKN